MKAALVREFGTAGTISIEDIDPPQPGADEVLLDVAACGVNFPDVLMIAGKYQVQPPMPFVPGIEISGRIREVGRNVRSLEIGQRVIAYASHGGLAEQAVVSADRVIPIPESISYTNAAAFAVAYGTSFHALRQRAQLAPGESLLVLGAAGGVGLAAVELGKLMGAHVIAAASDAEKLALAHSYGADELIDYRQADLRQSVRESTAGRGVDVVFDPVGGPMTEQCLRCLAWKGRLLIVGFASGEIPRLAANLPLLKGSSVVGVFWGAFTEHEPGANRDNNATLLGHLERGELHPHICATFPLSQAAQAVGTLAERRALGKVVVTMQ
jgi:NADPH2:quinone reductase